MDLVVTARHIAAAKAVGACSSISAHAGMSVTEVPQHELMWFAKNCPQMAAEVEAEMKLPLWTLSGDGYGDGGYGDGDGYGDGYGSGYGDGSGYG